MYSKKVIEHFTEPHNQGKMEDADVIGEAGNIKCGDIMKLQIKVKDNKIEDIGFQTFGCMAAIATSDVVCELAKGKTINQAKKLTKSDTPGTRCNDASCAGFFSLELLQPAVTARQISGRHRKAGQ